MSATHFFPVGESTPDPWLPLSEDPDVCAECGVALDDETAAPGHDRLCRGCVDVVEARFNSGCCDCCGARACVAVRARGER